MISSIYSQFCFDSGRFSYELAGNSSYFEDHLTGWICLCTGIIVPEPSRPEIEYYEKEAKTVLKSFLKYGKGFTASLSGQFSFVIVNPRVKKLLIGQDCFGLAPAFYYYHDQKITFCNRLDLISKSLPHQQINLSYLADYLEFGEPISAETPYTGVKRLTFGETKLFRSGKTVESVHPVTSVFESTNQAEHGKGVQDTFLCLLQASLNLKKFKDGKIWCEVSGGLDSTSVFYCAKPFYSDLTPLSVLSRSHQDDGDTDILLQLFSTGKKWNRLYGEDALPFSVMPDHSLIAEPGTEIFHQNLSRYASLLRQNEVDLLMTGFGGDLVLGGQDIPPFYLADLLWKGSFQELIEEINRFSAYSQQNRKHAFWLYHYCLRTIFQHLKKVRVTYTDTDVLPTWLDPQFRKKYHLGHRWKNLSLPRLNSPGHNAFLQELLISCTAEAGSFSSHMPCPVYHPLLYKPLVNFMFSLPPEYRLNGLGDRILQRKALRKIVPDIVLDRKKKGTMQHLFTQNYQQSKMWQDKLTKSSFLLDLGVFDQKEWHSVLQKARFGLFSSSRDFINSISLEIWLQNNFT